MGSKKSFLIPGLLAMILLFSSEVAARDLKEAEFVKETNEVGDAKYVVYPNQVYGNPYPVPPGNGGGSCGNNGCCSGAYGRGCIKCCSYAGEAVAVPTQDKTHN